VDFRISHFDQHHEGLASAFATSGDTPDIALVENAYLPQFLARPDDFVDLRRWGADDLADTYLSWRWDQGVGPDGQVVGLPTDVGGLAIAYRQDLFAAADMPSEAADVSREFASWESFVSFGERFAAANTGVDFVDSIDSMFLARMGQAPITYVGADGELALDREDGIAAGWALTTTMVDLGLTSGIGQFSPEWSDAMSTGKFAALAAPSWMRGYIAARTPETAGDWRLVAVPGKLGNWGGSQLTIPAAAEHPEEAWELISFLTTPEAQLDIFRDFGNLPTTPEIYARPEIQGLADPFFGGDQVGRLYVESVSGQQSRPYAVAERELDRIVLDTLREYAAGNHASAAEAWATAVARIEAVHASSG